ncbi:MAG: DUF547 domain-containing protein [Deltaproteobacteria bacterium]|nr:DUF547 domain-containing protein [Deltaproteobacteria bacterium]
MHPHVLALATLSLSLSLSLVSPAAHAFDHAPFDTILRAHVRHGRVDYAAIKAGSSHAALNAYIKALGDASLSGMNRNAKLAFYLNAYNALVIKSVVDRWPQISSVVKVSGFFDRSRFKVAGRALTLNQLEKKVILPTFKDPRVHFALVCAARSCPPLGSRAFSARGLDGVLQKLARRFVNSRHGVQVQGEQIRVSKLFEWYAKDFGNVGAFLGRYHRQHGAKLVAAKRFSYLKYDWALNKR